MKATYRGGNVVTITLPEPTDTLYITMTQLREMMEQLERDYREQSCCPSCGALTLDGRTCADCKRYEATRDCCAHGVPIEAHCLYCDDMQYVSG